MRTVADQFAGTSTSCGFEADSCSCRWQPQQQPENGGVVTLQMQGDPGELKFSRNGASRIFPLDLRTENFHGLRVLPMPCTIPNATAQAPRISKGERM
jgi:hypothetical protein